jgi:hypothetical protein
MKNSKIEWDAVVAIVAIICTAILTIVGIIFD